MAEVIIDEMNTQEVSETLPQILVVPFREDTPQNQKKRLNKLMEITRERIRNSKGGEMASRRTYLRKMKLKLGDLYKPTI